MDRFGWIGQTRQRALQDASGKRLRHWVHRWSVASDAAPPEVEILESAPCLADEFLFSARQQSARVVLALNRSAWRRLICRWMEIPSEATGDAFAGELSLEALEDMVAHWLDPDSRGLDKCETLAHPPTAATDAQEWGCVWLRIAFGQYTMFAHLNRAAVDRLSPISSQRRNIRSLVSRENSLDANPLKLQVVLPIGKAQLGEIAELSIGDVLLTERELDAAVDVCVPGGAVLSTARLGAREGRFAVSLSENKAESLEKQ